MKTNIKYICLSLFLIIFSNCSEDKLLLTGKGTITGKVVTLGDNLPLENVRISTSPATSTVFTNAAGDFIITPAIVGTYSVEARKDGFLTKFESATVQEEATVNVIFELNIETANNDAPTAPILVSPANNAVDLDISVDLMWTATDPESDPITYGVEILNDQNSDVITFSDLTDTTITVPGLNYGTKYFWQVSASDGINDAVLSDVYSFETLAFPTNRILFTRKINGNNVIFSADEVGNELQLTSSSSNSWRPRKARTIDKIAYLSTNGGQTHIYTMNLDGSDAFQVTSTTSVTGFNLEELDFEWKSNDTKILFPNFNKLYQINPTGGALFELHETLNGNFITEIDWNESTSKIAIKTNNSSGYNVEIYTINTVGVIQDYVLQAVTGAAGGLDFSFDGNKLLYTYDITGNENAEYRQLNTNMFIYDFTALTATNVSLDKPVGSNDLDPRFSPNEAEIIFVNTSNDGVSQNDISTIDVGAITTTRETIILDGKMPDWK